MQIKFNDKINHIIKKIALEAERFGVKIYFVGGLVRDVLMGKTPLDIDILVEGNAINFVKSLDFVEIKSIHKDFGTVKTEISGVNIDFASTRIEEYPKSGCLPHVTKIGCDIKDDLIRRDFTINAIAARILPSLDYEIIDIFNGCDDISKGVLKVLHKNSYIDDPTRILRGLDFKLRFNFDFFDEDEKLIQEYLKNPDRDGLSTDRVILTLNKLFSSNERAMSAISEFSSCGYYKILFDEFLFNRENFENAIKLFNIKDIGSLCLKYILEPIEILPEFKSRLGIYKYFKNYSDIDLCVHYLKTNDNNTLIYYNELKNVKLYLKGSDLLNLGFNQGKIIGFILDKVLEAKLSKMPDLISFNDEIEFVKRTFKL